MCCHNFAPTSSGPGITDLPWVAVRPISLAYSGVMLATVPVPRVAMCQTTTKARNSAIDTIAARKRSEKVMTSAGRSVARARRSTKQSEVVRRRTGTVRVCGGPGSATHRYALRAARCFASGTRDHDSSRCLPDLEAVEIILRLGRVEGLAHDRERFVRSLRRRQSHRWHDLAGIGCEINLFRHRLVIHIACDLTPALHLGQHPDRERLPGEGVEVDALGVGFDAPQSVRVGPGKNLLQDGDRRVDIVRRRDGLRDLLAIFGFRGV